MKQKSTTSVLNSQILFFFILGHSARKLAIFTPWPTSCLLSRYWRGMKQIIFASRLDFRNLTGPDKSSLCRGWRLNVTTVSEPLLSQFSLVERKYSSYVVRQFNPRFGHSVNKCSFASVCFHNCALKKSELSAFKRHQEFVVNKLRWCFSEGGWTGNVRWHFCNKMKKQKLETGKEASSRPGNVHLSKLKNMETGVQRLHLIGQVVIVLSV